MAAVWRCAIVAVAVLVAPIAGVGLDAAWRCALVSSLIAPAVGVDVEVADVEVAARSWWDTAASPRFAHLVDGRVLQNVETWKRLWLDRFSSTHNLAGRRVVEYGIGAARLGIVMLREYHALSYTGIDISTKTLKVAANQLRNAGLREDVDFSLRLTPVDFASLRADVFISQAVIQHFPSQAYTEAWLRNLNDSGIPVLMLQPRYSRTPTFSNWGLSHEPHPTNIKAQTFGTQMDSEYMLRHLTRYRLEWASEVQPGIRYVFYTFVLRQ